MENAETAGQAALRETMEEAGARIELGPAFSLVSVPLVNQVHLFYRARLLDLEFKPGEESLEVALFEEKDVPWPQLAFRTVGFTLKQWFEDRARGSFGFHTHDIPAR
jgi:8-oxo-dGTP pyrophosphatase MutT (NUDIX family)